MVVLFVSCFLVVPGVLCVLFSCCACCCCGCYVCVFRCPAVLVACATYAHNERLAEKLLTETQPTQV